ncbi:MAG: pseudouridine synthase [Pirellula sp.]
MSPRKARPQQTPQEKSQPELQRINKVLAAAGLGSRRQVDELIEQGRVEIDGQVITQVGVKVDLANATISVDGEELKQHRPVYFALHKPEGVLCTNRDPQGRPRVIDFVPNQHRLFPVGRLDASSTGLILLTNDGELAQQLAHPKHEIPKRYAVVVVGQVELDALKRLERGIYLAEGKAQVDQAKLKKVRKSSTELEITLSEGKNREIRRVLARLGHKVVSLKRIAIGTLRLGDLPEGAYRPLSNQEVQGLYQAVDDIRRERKAARKARKKLLASEEVSSSKDDAPSKPAKGPKAKPSSAHRPPKKSGKPWEKLPGMDQNPYATEEDLDDPSIDEQDDEMILVRDHGPLGSSIEDSDEEYFFMPRKPAGSIIGQEDELEPGPWEEKWQKDGGQKDLGQKNSGQKEARQKEGGQKNRGQKKGEPREYGPKNGGQRNEKQRNFRQKNSGRKNDRGEYSELNEGGENRGGVNRSGTKRASTKRASTKRGSTKRSGAKRGGIKRGGPKASGTQRGGPKRGPGRSARGRSK